MVHDQHIHFQMTCICQLFIFYALPRASYVYIQYGFIPSVVWRFYSNF